MTMPAFLPTLSYSNLGIALPGSAIQNQSGMPFADYMKQSQKCCARDQAELFGIPVSCSK